MPFYEYEVILEDGEPGARFEVMQKMSDPPLTHHPTTGQPVRRVLSVPTIIGSNAEKSAKKALGDDSKLESLGFTKYVNEGGGRFKKSAGKGPDVISPD